MADTGSHAIAEAAAHFADIWAGLLRGELADNYDCALTCPEANAAADLYRALGLDDWADDIIAAHAEHDTSQDQHYRGDSARDAAPRVLQDSGGHVCRVRPGGPKGRRASPVPVQPARVRWQGRGSALPGFAVFQVVGEGCLDLVR